MAAASSAMAACEGVWSGRASTRAHRCAWRVNQPCAGIGATETSRRSSIGASSLATVNFINNVGFETAEDGKKTLVMVDFSHTRKDVDAEGNEVNKDIAIRVPLLAMLPIPSLRIEHVIIDFKVKLNSVESSKVSDKLGVSVSAGGGFGPVNFKVSASYERQTSTGVEVKKEYALTVNVKAVQDEIPAGLEKILNMLAA